MKRQIASAIVISLILLLALTAVASGQSPDLAASVQPDETEDVMAHTIKRFRQTVDSANDVGSHVSVALHPASGIPYVSYYGGTTGDLRMAVYVGTGGDCGPDNSWHCQTVDSGGDVGKYSSIDIRYNPSSILPSRTRVGISYYDATSGDLKYALYSWNLLSGWGWTISTIQTGNVGSFTTAGTHTSLKFDSTGTPHIAYRYSVFLVGNLRYASHVGSGGNCGSGGAWQCDTVDSGIGVGSYTSLAFDDNDKPRITYYDGGNGDLKYAYMTASGSCGTTGNWGCYTIDDTDDVGRWTSLAISEDANNTPHIAYYDVTNGRLKYAVWDLANGNCGPVFPIIGQSWVCITLDDIGASNEPMDISLALTSSGSPRIAYHDINDIGTFPVLPTQSLKFARKHLLGGNCGPGIGLFKSWTCETLDTGLRGQVVPIPMIGYNDVGSYVSMGINSADLFTVAYYDADYGDLLVIQEWEQLYLPLQQKN